MSQGNRVSCAEFHWGWIFLIIGIVSITTCTSKTYVNMYNNAAFEACLKLATGANGTPTPEQIIACKTNP